MGQTWDSEIKEHLRLVDEMMEASIISCQPELTNLCRHVLSSGGKRIRPGICILSFFAAGGKDADRVIRIATAFELIHSATLIHDDINDDSEIRRGRATAHNLYSVPKAIIAGDFLFVQGFRLGGVMEEPVINFIADACNSMAESEFVQLDYEGKPETSVDTYLEIIEGKTARPIEAGARVGAFMAEAEPEVIEALGGFGLNVGLAFQIADDILDVEGEKVSTGKEPGIDILEGKPTLPLILAMEDPEKGLGIRRIFAQKEKSEADVEEALRLIRSTDAIEKSKAYALEFVNKAKEYLDKIPPSVYRESLFRLADYVVERTR
ncbi:MAG: octaprenyl-diphosphate synthase [Candidatus Methanomethylophilaceae archaeon]|nr:octaprenyl-diphosphate synthase [Candidatus Methanomethylophilaceae archaeon]HIJ00550.1 polyprenyl synthetase family protein [Candidatus Methanomethylophilaceae archaeon]